MLWSRDGKTLFYRQGSVVMAATLGRGRGIEVVERHRLFSGSFLELWWGTWGGIAPDGRFLMIHRGPRSFPDRINVVLNWTSELERLAGAR